MAHGLIFPHLFILFLKIKAQDIHVGNIVWLRENDEVPCDLVLVGTSDPQGVCYVEVTDDARLPYYPF